MIRKLSDFITRHCYLVFAAILALAGACVLLSSKVKINHDIYSYMPADSGTSQGLQIMDDEFDFSATSSYKIMFENLPESERYEVKSYIENVDHVKSVAYDDSDAYNRTVDDKTYTLYEITIDAAADSVEANTTYRIIFDHFNNEYTFYESGQVFANNGSVIKPLVTAFAIACAMLILTLMSESYLEPWLYLFAILIAVLLNKGTNIIFPSVSHITDGISMVLQMALSMDYAIMLSSRYRQEKANLAKPDKFLAMRRALNYSFGAISSSSLTTVVGLIVLVVMSFTIGRDMGLVLSKGVVLSLVSIFTTLPALLLFFDKLIAKTKKRTLHFNLKWLGTKSFHFRKIALPVFAVIFIAALLLKGNVNILFTGSENDAIKDVFPEVNQTALIYDNSEEGRVNDFCHQYENKAEVSRVFCYGNTIGEPEKYDEIIAKANSLSNLSVSGVGAAREKTDELTTEDYLVKILYYYYFRDENHTMSLAEFVTFAQNEVINNPDFAADLSAGTAEGLERLSNFVVPEKINRPRSKAELAALLEIDSADLDDLFILYYSKHPRAIKLTLYDFANFVMQEVLTNPKYSALISQSQRDDLAKLLLFSDSRITSAKKSATELANLFGLDPAQVEQLLVYYEYTTKTEPTVALKPAELVDFILSDPTILAELNLSAEDAAKLEVSLADVIAELKTSATNLETDLLTHLDAALAASELPAETQTEIRERVTSLVTDFNQRVTSLITADYTYEDYANFATRLEDYYDAALTKLSEINTEYDLNLDLDRLPALNFDPYLAKLKEVYRLYEAEASAATRKLTPAEFIDFLLAHKDDDRLKTALTPDKVELLNLAQYVIKNQKTLFSATELANAFGLDADQLALLFAFYDYRHISGDPHFSIKALLTFLTESVLSDGAYANRFTDDQRAKIYQVSDLIHAAEAGTQYTSSALYRTLLPFSDSLDSGQLFLLYLYHGSLYDYQTHWAITIEEFIDFLNAKVLPDARFASRIDAETNDKIKTAQTTVKDAKAMLVGPQHSRALLETYLPAEGVETFSFLGGIETDLGPGLKSKYFVIGDSAMAYEISQTFSDEMDFITILTMISIFIVVAITFRSLLIPALLVLVIQSAVYLNMSYLSLTGQGIYFIALIIVQAILMGATIDYAILFTSYYLEYRRKFDIKESLISAYNNSIHAILTSASILILVTAVVGNFATAIAAKICQSISGGTLCATLIILLLLPALLATLDRWIVKRKKS